MQEELKEFINKIKDMKGLNTYDEQTTKQVIIIKILNLLGWSTTDVRDIQPEYPVDPHSNDKVDYALAKDTENIAFIEAKPVSANLQDHTKQLCNYCSLRGVSLGILTNGISWWFYLPQQQHVGWHVKKFYSIDLIEQQVEDISSNFIDFLSRQNVITGKAIENATRVYESKRKKQIIKESLPKAWNRLIFSGDTQQFIDMFSDIVETICGYTVEPKDVEEFLIDNKDKLTFPPEETEELTKKGYRAQLEEGKQSNYARTGNTGKFPKAVTFNNKRHEVNSWKEVLLFICEEVRSSHINEFEKVLSLVGRKRPYFTKDPNKLRTPEKIKGTDIFAEVGWSANDIVKICESILTLFGYKEDIASKIEYQDRIRKVKNMSR